jgi:hypothetical protein
LHVPSGEREGCPLLSWASRLGAPTRTQRRSPR